MHIVTYYKFGSRWYMDFPAFIEKGGDPEDLERIGAFHDFLEYASQGKSTVVFEISAQPFEGADEAILTGTSGGNSGGYYSITSFNNKPMEFELWLETNLYIHQEELPKSVYFKQVNL